MYIIISMITVGPSVDLAMVYMMEALFVLIEKKNLGNQIIALAV